MPKVEQPTDEQIKEFWEGCGLNKRGGYWWYDQQGKHLTADKPPVINLNNLFEYALPKLIRMDGSGQGGVEFRFYPGGTSCILTLADESGFNEQDYFLKEGHDPALALFWAIWEVIHGTAK